MFQAKAWNNRVDSRAILLSMNYFNFQGKSPGIEATDHRREGNGEGPGESGGQEVNQGSEFTI